MNLAFVLLPGTAQTFELKGKATYDKVSQVIANPDTYIENVVAPVCEILSSYPDVVLSVDVLSNPEGEIYDTSKIYGTSWNVVQNFIKKNAAAVKKALPNVPVMASSADRDQTAVKAGLFNNLGLDVIGVTNYDDGGRVTKAKDLHTTEPVWVVDMGVDDVEITEKNLATSVKALYENAKTSGYRAAFFAQYGDQELGAISPNSLIGGERQPAEVGPRCPQLASDEPVRSKQCGVRFRVYSGKAGVPISMLRPISAGCPTGAPSAISWSGPPTAPPGAPSWK